MVSEHEIDPFIEEIAAELKRPVRFDSTFDARVMAAIETSAESSMKAKSTPWILRPRTFYVSPLAGLSVAAGLVALITMSVLRTQPNKSMAASSDTSLALPSNPVIPVSNPVAVPAVAVSAPFTYIDRGAKSVAVVGSFNDWDTTRTVLTRPSDSDSVWTANVMLFPGRYEYQLVVDGKWIADPSAQQSARSEFGAANSVMIVSPVPR